MRVNAAECNLGHSKNQSINIDAKNTMSNYLDYALDGVKPHKLRVAHSVP
jgi:hypothetical protein